MCLCICAFLCSCGCRRINLVNSSYYDELISYIDVSDIIPEKNPITSSSSSATVISADLPKSEEADFVKLSPTKITDTSPYLCYTHLSPEQKTIYEYALTAAKNLQTGWFGIGKYTKNLLHDALVAYTALTADHPEFFWLSKHFILHERDSADNSYMTFSYTSDEYNCDYLFPIEQIDAKKSELDAKISEILSATALLSDFETELYFHDFLCETVTYNKDGGDTIFTSYGALIDGVAVCEGYSRAMQLLCKKAGIPCTLVLGLSKDDDHMWNLVQLDNEWYHLDVTWDDCTTFTSHTYFNVTDEQIKTDHRIYPVNIGANENDTFNIFTFDCTAVKYNYFLYKSFTLTTDISAVATLIQEEAQNGKNHIELAVLNNKILNDISSVVQKISRELSLIPDCNVELDSYSSDGGVLTLFFK